MNYVFSGLTLPGERTTIKAGSTLPVFFSLDGDQGMGVLVSASWQQGSTVRPATGKLVYNAYAMRYQYLWKTPAGVTGQVRLTLTLADGTTPWIGVTLK